MSRVEQGVNGTKSPVQVDTVVVGNGPSSLILSYILHGHIPTYDPSHPHPDPLLNAKLKGSVDLLQLDVDYLTEHFPASRFSYSTQALPINALVDTLIRPNGDTEAEGFKTCVKWDYRPERAVAHIVLGKSSTTGGQWAENPVDASWDIGTLSYGGMLSLPGYSFEEHYQKVYGQTMQCYLRPTRREVADYFAHYPEVVGIADSIHCGETLNGISRTSNGFYIPSHDIYCNHLVLATGIFSQLIPARSLLQPLLQLPKHAPGHDSPPMLVVGSGFTAADVIITAPSNQKIIHIFKWAPDTRPSPLRACHQHAYPEYAGVYRRMKVAATAYQKKHGMRPKIRRGSSTPFLEGRDWDRVYEGHPNTVIVDVRMQGQTATVELEGDDGVRFEREIGSLAYVVGRRGSLDYLNDELREEVLEASVSSSSLISGQTLREKTSQSTEVAPKVFVTGSLTGDSLVRFSYGGVMFAAGSIMSSIGSPSSTSGSCSPTKRSAKKGTKPAMNGMAGHNCIAILERDTDPNSQTSATDVPCHPLDRRKGIDCVELAVAQGKVWRDSGFWGGGTIVSSRFPDTNWSP